MVFCFKKLIFHGRKDDHPLTCHTAHICGEPGAQPFIDSALGVSYIAEQLPYCDQSLIQGINFFLKINFF